MNTSFKAPYYQLIRKASFTSSNRYNKFVNWVSGEFDLFLQDRSNDLHVFLPGGSFNIKNTLGVDNHVVAIINLKSKTSQNGIDIMNKIMSIYDQLAKVSSENF